MSCIEEGQSSYLGQSGLHCEAQLYSSPTFSIIRQGISHSWIALQDLILQGSLSHMRQVSCCFATCQLKLSGRGDVIMHSWHKSMSSAQGLYQMRHGPLLGLHQKGVGSICRAIQCLTDSKPYLRNVVDCNCDCHEGAEVREGRKCHLQDMCIAKELGNRPV